MKNLTKTPWVNGYSCKKQARIYKTQGGKIAVQVVLGYGLGAEPSHVTMKAPKYYTTVLGAFDSLESSGFGDVVTIDQIRKVLK